MGKGVLRMEMANLPAYQYLCRKQRCPWSMLFLSSVLLANCSVADGNDLRDTIKDGSVECFKYDENKNLFYLQCSVNWDELGYGDEHFMTLKAGEEFDGNHFEIDVEGTTNFKGLFKIDDTDIHWFEKDAPLIRRLHVLNGETAEDGGFIVRHAQTYFRVDSCSSTGEISGLRSGGICGNKAATDDGKIKVTNSFSKGTISGKDAGGICGASAGTEHGQVTISRCYSLGDLTHENTGGIVGTNAAVRSNTVHISQCFSQGKIKGLGAGGIAGIDAGEEHGKMYITDCYTTGGISKKHAGGIVGWNTAENDGSVFIRNCYASGTVEHEDAGGIIGHIAKGADSVAVENSVYTTRLVGGGEGVKDISNSNDLDDITGKLYKAGEPDGWSSELWVVHWTHNLPILRFNWTPFQVKPLAELPLRQEHQQTRRHLPARQQPVQLQQSLARTLEQLRQLPRLLPPHRVPPQVPGPGQRRFRLPARQHPVQLQQLVARTLEQ
eukprot:gb/GECG01010484.1/.p1 GENE.gb/GECG01010484.1/~~gb/GECG01010484.1/.p1  ORF type:complete len:495 (+),score=52.32 gb/GECG01010484.1/:1-1485(+)